jgi:hypothetical protein
LPLRRLSYNYRNRTKSNGLFVFSEIGNMYRIVEVIICTITELMM